MKNSPFLTGLLLSPFLIVAYWGYNTYFSDTQKTQPSSSLSLADINYIPLKPKQPFPLQPFHKIEDQGVNQITIQAFANKPAIIHLWAPWCSPCVQEMPSLNQFAADHNQDLHVVAIVMGKQPSETIKEFYKNHHIQDMSIYIDENGTLARELKVNSLPTSIFVNTKGQELGRIIGPIHWQGEPGKLIKSYLCQ